METNKPAKTYETVIFRILWIMMLALFCLTLFIFLNDRSFVTNEMQTWKDATAIVMESGITKDPTITQREDSSDNVYYEYRVDYMYVAQFDAWGGPFSFTYEDANIGKLNRRTDEIPKSAFVIPKPGDSIAVIYDPETQGIYRIGSLAEWKAKAELTFENLAFPIVFGLVAIAMFCLDIFFRRRKKKAQ